MVALGVTDESLPAYHCDVCGVDWPDDGPPALFEQPR